MAAFYPKEDAVLQGNGVGAASLTVEQREFAEDFPFTQNSARSLSPRTRPLNTSSNFVLASDTGSVTLAGVFSPVGRSFSDSVRCSRTGR